MRRRTLVSLFYDKINAVEKKLNPEALAQQCFTFTAETSVTNQTIMCRFHSFFLHNVWLYV